MKRNFLYRHELRYHPELRVGDDYLLSYSFLLLGARWLQIPSGRYFYSPDVSSLTAGRLAFQREMIASTETVLRDLGLAKCRARRSDGAAASDVEPS